MKRSNFGPTNKTPYSSNISLFSSNDNLPDQKVNNNSKRSRIESNVNENACSNDNFNNGPSTSKSFNSNRTTTHLVNSGLNGKKDNFPIISKSIWNYFSKNMQSIECFQRKLELKDALYHMFKEIFPYLGVFIVGSSANGFGTNLSDVDICLMVSHEEINQKTEAICLLKLIARAMRKAAFIEKLQVIGAKVPIIKFHDKLNNIDCDININNHIGIRNTHLLKSYSDTDWRVKPLILSIKNWAKYQNINDASKQTLSSYSLALMAIYYLQTCVPAVLPVLQQLRPDKFDLKTDIRTLRLNDECYAWNSSNNQTLGDLFVGFLELYSAFEFEKFVISVRTGGIIPKICLPSQLSNGNSSMWKFILIEEPFDLTNTARAVYEYNIFHEIVGVFQKSLKTIKQTKSYDQLFIEKYFDPTENYYSRF